MSKLTTPHSLYQIQKLPLLIASNLAENCAPCWLYNIFTLNLVRESFFSDLSFAVLPKERIAFAGHNGAGKSTLMKCIAGIFNTQ